MIDADASGVDRMPAATATNDPRSPWRRWMDRIGTLPPTAPTWRVRLNELFEGITPTIIALAGKNAVMAAITRVSDRPYRWKITAAPLSKVANVEKMLPRDFIARDGYGITAKARAYLGPLIKGEAPPPFKDGLPKYVRLKNVPVARKLPGFKV